MNPDQTQDRLEGLLAQISAEQARGVKMGTGCQVHAHDEWVPLEDHHIWPLGMGGPDTKANLVTVCRNGHGAIHAYMDLLVRYGGTHDSVNGEGVPWATARRFGPKVRGLAEQGWVQAGMPRRRVAEAAPPQ